jgi:hypothetical protein
VWFAVAAALAAESPRAVRVDEGLPLLSLGPAPDAPPAAPSPDGARWTEPVAADLVAGVGLGDPWVVLGNDGSRAECRVVGFRRTAEDAQGYGSEADPSCGGWVVWGELACDGSAVDGVAVPGRRTSARTFAERPPTSAERGIGARALATTPEWRSLTGWLGGNADLHLVYDVRPFGPWLVVEGTAYTGEGWAACGGADLLERRVLVADASGRVVLPARALATPWGVEQRIVDGVSDLDRDGVPELRITRPLEAVSTVTPDGGEVAPLPTPFCGCPC